MDILLVEVKREILKYLTSADLKTVRLWNSTWNDLAKYSLQRRRRGPMTFTFNSVNRLAQFNDTFVNYQPMGELALAHFSFLLPALASDEVSAHLDTFGQAFGQSVTSITLCFKSPTQQPMAWGQGTNFYWHMSRDREAMDRNFTLLLAKVKGQLQKLELKDYLGLSPSVLGSDPFPALSTLTVENDRSEGGRAAAIQEACLLELSRKVPAILDFNFGRYGFSSSTDDPAFLPTVLRNLVQANPEVRCKLNLCLPWSASEESLIFVRNLAEVDAHVHELRLDVPPEGAGRQDFRLLLQYVGGQSNRLKKMTLVKATSLGDAFSSVLLQLPSMPVLEELDLTQVSLMAVNGGYADYLPSLRCVTMDYSVNDLSVTLPSVTELTLVKFGNALETQTAGEDFRRFISNFSNLRSLTCSLKFLELPAIFTQVNLTRLKIRDHGNIFWDIVTAGSPRLTFGQIVDLDVTLNGEGSGAFFKDLGNLRELVFTDVYRNEEALGAVLYISKLGKLKRLQKLIFECRSLQRWNTEVTTNYLRELHKYHDSVAIIHKPVLNYFLDLFTL